MQILARRNELLAKHDYDELKMVRGAEVLYFNGFAPLPDTFYERSLFTNHKIVTYSVTQQHGI